MHRRIACIALPDIRVEIAKEREGRLDKKAASHERSRGLDLPVPASSSPLAVIIARSGGAVKTERDVLGNTRIDFVSREAGLLGVHPGQTVAAARAKCAILRVRVVAEGAVASALARVAEAALAFGPTTSFDVAHDVVWVDVGGCAHLHGGEVELARALRATVQALGHACRVAVADGPHLSAAVARFSDEPGSKPSIVPPGKGDIALRPLPIAALGLDHDMCVWLAELGLSTCGDLQKLPRRSLGTRLGDRSQDVMKLLDGQDRSPLEPWRPPEVPEERVEFDWGVNSTEALAFVLKTLCDRLAARLIGRAMTAAGLELVLTLDRALCKHAGPNGHRMVLSMVLPSPIARGADLLGVVRTRVERCSLPAPVVAVTLRAPDLAQSTSRTLELLTPEPKADHVLPRLVGELAAQIGEESVGTLTLVDTWSPDERTRLLPFGMTPTRSPTTHVVSLRQQALLTSALEPSRLVEPRPVSPDAIGSARLIARVEGLDWWKTAGHRQAPHSGRSPRDLYAAWVDGALSWLELRNHTDLAMLRGWID